MRTQFELNGRLLEIEHHPGSTLMELLREDQNLFSVKHGCDHGECGACTVLVNDRAMNACLLLVHSIAGKRVETLEGLNLQEGLNPLQEEFLASGAAQCGFCTPGMELSIEALKREARPVGESHVRDALAGNLCRCTGYVKPVEAALKTLKGDRS